MAIPVEAPPLELPPNPVPPTRLPGLVLPPTPLPPLAGVDPFAPLHATSSAASIDMFTRTVEKSVIIGVLRTGDGSMKEEYGRKCELELKILTSPMPCNCPNGSTPPTICAYTDTGKVLEIESSVTGGG